MGAFCCHGNQSFDQICPKTLCNISSTLVMLHIKFDKDWPTGLRYIQVQKCGRRRTTDRLVYIYYELTLWAFGSGELKMTLLCTSWLLFTGNMSKWQSFTRSCDKGSYALALTSEVNLATEFSAPSAAELREPVGEFQSLIVWERNCSCKCQY